jgi:hypothetical protein
MTWDLEVFDESAIFVGVVVPGNGETLGAFKSEFENVGVVIKVNIAIGLGKGVEHGFERLQGNLA